MTNAETPTLNWHRAAAGGYYANSPAQPFRYYVTRTDVYKWSLEVYRTVVVSGVQVIEGNKPPIIVERFNPSASLTKALAAAYDVEPNHAEGVATNRMTRAIAKAFA